MHWWSVNNRQRHDGSLPRSWPSLNPTGPRLHRGSFASYALARYDKYCTRYKLRRVLHFTSNKKWFPWPHVNVIFNWHNKKAQNSKVKFGPSQFCIQFDGNIIWWKQGQIHLLIVQRYWSALVPCVNLWHFRRRQRACWTRGTATGGRLQFYLVGDNLLLKNTRGLCIVQFEAQWREVC